MILSLTFLTLQAFAQPISYDLSDTDMPLEILDLYPDFQLEVVSADLYTSDFSETEIDWLVLEGKLQEDFPKYETVLIRPTGFAEVIPVKEKKNSIRLTINETGETDPLIIQ